MASAAPLVANLVVGFLVFQTTAWLCSNLKADWGCLKQSHHYLTIPLLYILTKVLYKKVPGSRVSKQTIILNEHSKKPRYSDMIWRLTLALKLCWCGLAIHCEGEAWLVEAG